MGSALTIPLVDRGHQVRLVGTHLDRHIIRALKAGLVHPKLGLVLPKVSAFFLEELETAVSGADILGVGVSSAGVRWAGEQLAPWAEPQLPVVMISKGLEFTGNSLRILPDVLASGWPGGVCPAAIVGPCIAGELARRVPTCVSIASRSFEVSARLCQELATDYYRLFPSDDVVGVEVCAALKNAYAMGIAFGSGLHEGAGGQPGSIARHNYESAIFAQAVVEMTKIVQALGGDPNSVVGLAGVGDLDVTCNGGRTGRFGHFLGLGLGVDEAVRRMQGATLECLDILAQMRAALPALEASGRLRSAQIPLLLHLAEVALDDASVDVPFRHFFEAST